MKIATLIVFLFGLVVPAATSAQTLPVPVSDDIWDVSQGVTVTSNSGLRPGADARDMFGGVFGGVPFEISRVMFQNELPVNTVHSVEWQTPQPVLLEKFRIFAYHDTSRPLNCGCIFPDARVHGFRTFRLFVKDQAGEWEQVYEHEPVPPNDRFYRIMNPEYQGIVPNNVPLGSFPFLHEATVGPVRGQEWRAEFVQYGDPTDPELGHQWSDDTGPRVVELDGFGQINPEPEREPVVIVPGLVGSHNRDCILYDRCAPGVGTWDFTPTVDWYDSLITRLKAEGYEQGKDLFIAFYDWRQSNIESAVEYLVPVIDEALAASGAGKVDIVAHSMGGIVARAYAQSGPQYRGDIDQLIMLGTPNEGAADAYTVWEGGDFPERWSFGSKQWISRIERALKKSRDQRSLARPGSLRSFFPSLVELVPINSFVVRGDQELKTDDLKLGRNLLLEALRDTVERLVGIQVLAIAGTGHGTLDKVTVHHDRTTEDLAFDRWRDGHANPDPPSPDSIAGDQTVLAASVHSVGSTAEVANALHNELPAKAQSLVVNALIENPTSQDIPFTLADSGLGIDVLSPIMPIVHGPNGETLSADENTFDHALFDWDPSDPDAIKMLTINNPPVGSYTVSYVGIGEGDYTIVTTFADENATVSTERIGTTNDGQQGTFTIFLNEDSMLVPPEDIADMVTELKDTLKNLRELDLISNNAFGKLNGAVGHLQGKVKSYEDKVQQFGVESIEAQKNWLELQQALAKFIQEFETQVGASLLDRQAIMTISGLIQKLEDAGL